MTDDVVDGADGGSDAAKSAFVEKARHVVDKDRRRAEKMCEESLL